MNDNNKYFIYARKSSESDERQTQSIEDQLDVIRKKAQSAGLTIVDTLTESMSAKEPGRIMFNEMINRINKGEANGIISWKLDRISRNPVDSGTIQYMLQGRGLDKVITNDREYNPVDAGLLMSVENGMSNQFLLDLSKNVKRGLESKVSKGWYPGPAPMGYTNDLKHKTIIENPNNFKIVKKLFKYMLSGDYTSKVLLDLANNEWGLRTNKGFKLCQSSFYMILNNVFYTGDFMWKGIRKEGNHKAMITYDDYNRIQTLLGDSGKAKLYKHEFPYTGIIKCGECNTTIVASHKFKDNKQTNTRKKYSYYRCNKRNKSITENCKQKAIRLEQLEKQIDKILGTLEVSPEFIKWSIDIIERDYKEEVKIKESNYNRLIKEQNNIRIKLDKLTDILIESRIDSNTYDKKKNSLEVELRTIEQSLTKSNGDRKNRVKLIGDVFNFTKLARESFKKGDYQTKKNIFRNLGLEYTLTDGVLAIELYPWLRVVNNNQYALTRKKGLIAPIKNSISTGRTDTISSIIPKWQGP